VWHALYYPSYLYSIAVNLPKAGETNLIKTPAKKYQTKTIPGPNHPTN